MIPSTGYVGAASGPLHLLLSLECSFLEVGMLPSPFLRYLLMVFPGWPNWHPSPTPHTQFPITLPCFIFCSSVLINVHLHVIFIYNQQLHVVFIYLLYCPPTRPPPAITQVHFMRAGVSVCFVYHHIPSIPMKRGVPRVRARVGLGLNAAGLVLSL